MKLDEGLMTKVAVIGAAAFDEAYFMRGKETGVSLYENYRYLPDLTIPMCQTIVNHLGIDRDDEVLDFGCARGYVVKAMRELGYKSYGYDASTWAVDNCDQEVGQYLTDKADVAFHKGVEYDWVIAKDVLEHVDGIYNAVGNIMRCARKGVFVVVPLSDDGRKYVVQDYELDVTHIHRWPLWRWAGMFIREGWSVEARHRLPGVKDNYFKSGWERGNGFITARGLA